MTTKILERKLKDAADFLKKNKTAAIAAGIGTIVLAPAVGALGAAGAVSAGIATAAAVATGVCADKLATKPKKLARAKSTAKSRGKVRREKTAKIQSRSTKKVVKRKAK